MIGPDTFFGLLLSGKDTFLVPGTYLGGWFVYEPLPILIISAFKQNAETIKIKQIEKKLFI
jgi:hypothetical protein